MGNGHHARKTKTKMGKELTCKVNVVDAVLLELLAHDGGVAAGHAVGVGAGRDAGLLRALVPPVAGLGQGQKVLYNLVTRPSARSC